MSQYRPRIAIVGGGPSGLTVGVLLHRHNIPFTVFDLRPKITVEDLAAPAGMLDLHEESGLAALRECGLLDAFGSLTSDCSEVQVVANKAGEIIYTIDRADMESRPEISRNTLTKLLLDHVPPEAIKWKHKLVAAHQHTTPSGTTEIELDFGPQNGKHTFDFVIGADGTWSRARNLLTDIKPHYAGIQLITVTARHVTTKYPDLAAYVGTGTFSALANRHGIMSQRGLQDSARVYICLTTPDEHFGAKSGIISGSASAAAATLLSDDALLGQFAPKLKSLVQTVCDEDAADHPGESVDIKPLYMLPIGHSWPHQPGVTVIGDASHVMCPWAAEGVNLAMWDALDVATAIISASTAAACASVVSFQAALDPLVQAFEQKMAARAAEYAQETVDNGKVMFGSEDGATATKEWLEGMVAMMTAATATATGAGAGAGQETQPETEKGAIKAFSE